ncbi:hypothetical protein GUJ93_ZPchr0005g14421 [Zizania palustris]|uniref:Uncharacterized protein n=1 Tax=Zizania palustris TaxID=103762 RepID=A0A8J5SLU4_ZIZPA|nr:hypothetical protein GUJ93_ZPchr0005g14421 [Zizania palustris]
MTRPPSLTAAHRRTGESPRVRQTTPPRATSIDPRSPSGEWRSLARRLIGGARLRRLSSTTLALALPLSGALRLPSRTLE